MNLKRKKGSLKVPKRTTRGMIKISVQGNIYQWEKGRPWLKYLDDNLVWQGLIQDFKLGGALKKIVPSGGRLENCWDIWCEKSRFYAKKSYFFTLDPPLYGMYSVYRVWRAEWYVCNWLYML